MEVEVQILDLHALHTRLVWDEIIAAAVLVLGEHSTPPFRFDLEVMDVPNFDDDFIRLTIKADRIKPADLTKRRRTFEHSHLVELAAIALGGFAVYHAAGHEIIEVATRGSGADYLVGDAQHLFEITGRSRREDFESAWQARWQRLQQTADRNFYLFAADFETPKGRRAFQPSIRE
jgi:hypothetical protein